MCANRNRAVKSHGSETALWPPPDPGRPSVTLSLESDRQRNPQWSPQNFLPCNSTENRGQVTSLAKTRGLDEEDGDKKHKKLIQKERERERERRTRALERNMQMWRWDKEMGKRGEERQKWETCDQTQRDSDEERSRFDLFMCVSVIIGLLRDTSHTIHTKY